MTGALVLNPLNDNKNGTNWLTVDSPMPGPLMTSLVLNGLMGSLTEIGVQHGNL